MEVVGQTISEESQPEKRWPYQQPQIPEVRRNGAEDLNNGCQENDILQVPETKTQI